MSAITTPPASFVSPPLNEREFEKFRVLILQKTGISLADNKSELLRTRLSKRLRKLGLKRFSDYYAVLINQGHDSNELSEFINCVTTNKTDFYREPHHFEYLRDNAFPQIEEIARRTGKKRLRIWSAACSTGPEPYTIAMTIRDYFDEKPGWDARILASDIDSECLRKATRGHYPEEMLETLSLEQKRRYFLRGTGPSAGQAAAKPLLKELIAFRRINFAESRWPIQTKFDVIFCRNAMIYFDRDFQAALVQRFMQHLHPHGTLILGHSENLSYIPELEPIGKTIYRLKQHAMPAGGTTVVGSPSEARAEKPIRTDANPADSGEPIRKGKQNKRPLVAGELFASREPVRITTLLGSCIAVCLYDPAVKAGGMNHFLLPEGGGADADSACYGINAMELLINELMNLGASRDRMVARLYGGGHVMPDQLHTTRVGDKNIGFVREYLDTEGIPILEQKVGGTKALRLSMTASTGEVIAEELGGESVKQVSRRDTHAASDSKRLTQTSSTDQVTIF